MAKANAQSCACHSTRPRSLPAMDIWVDAQLSVSASDLLVYVDSQLLSVNSPNASQRQEMQMR